MDDVESANKNTGAQFVQGDLWKSVKVKNEEIVKNKAIGQVSARVTLTVFSRMQPVSDTNFVFVIVLLRDRFPSSSSAPSAAKMQR